MLADSTLHKKLQQKLFIGEWNTFLIPSDIHLQSFISHNLFLYQPLILSNYTFSMNLNSL